MENKDIEIVEEEKEGISIGDIFKRIWHAKITLGVSRRNSLFIYKT